MLIDLVRGARTWPYMYCISMVSLLFAFCRVTKSQSLPFPCEPYQLSDTKNKLRARMGKNLLSDSWSLFTENLDFVH